jgi:hypothetical protein
MLGFRERPLHGPVRRLRTALLNRFSNRPPRTQRVSVVTIHGERFKRVVLPDSHHAERYARSLGLFGASGIYPSLLLVRENELWVEFVEGRKIERVEAGVVDKLARLIAVIYARDSRLVATDQTPFPHALHTDLRFLAQVGVLPETSRRRLSEAAERLTPPQVWVGYDCTDAILKNFVICADGRIRGIDIESLQGDQLIGSGVAKACLRWLGSHRERFIAEVRAHATPDFDRYLPFVELSFLAFWQKSSVLEKKRRFVDPTLFDRFLEG